MNISVEHLNQVIAGLHEFNPMMGHRGCRLDVTYPEIAKMQTAAIIKAALAVRSRRPAWKIVPEIMVPLVGEAKELAYVKSVIDKTAKKIIKDAGSDMEYKVGTMIEIPRAALTADEIAKEAAFFSFGTNDLTQMTFGFSRDDAGKFLASYYDRKIYESDPFSSSIRPAWAVWSRWRRSSAVRPARTSSSASAASRAATRRPSSSATTSA